MSFSLNPEIEPQQGRGKLDVLVSSRRGTSTDTTGPNCSPVIFFSPLIWFFRATKRDLGFWSLGDNHRCWALSNIREKFPWMPDVPFPSLFSCSPWTSLLTRFGPTFPCELWSKDAILQGIRDCLDTGASPPEEESMAVMREWLE